jgi:hypothetical protein
MQTPFLAQRRALLITALLVIEHLFQVREVAFVHYWCTNSVYINSMCSHNMHANSAH